MADVILDLFGEPVPADRGPGRPAFEWTQEKSNRVNMLFACGYEPKDVAPVLGCCLKTFRRVFSRECRDRRNAELKFRSHQMLRLNAQAAAGSVPADKALAAMMQAERVKMTAGRIVDRGRSVEPKAPPLGKREQARVDAAGIVGRCATREPPPLLQ